MTRSRRRKPRPLTLEEECDKLLSLFIWDALVERIPRTRLEGLQIAHYQRMGVQYEQEHADFIAETIARTKEERGEQASAGAVFDRLLPDLLAWARQYEPDLLDKPAGMY